VVIRGAPDVPEWAWTYGTNVLARFLDSDEDGQPDDADLVAALAPNEHRVGFALLVCRGSIGRDLLKDSWYGIARTQGQESLSSDTRFQAQVIEEFHHGIFHGLEKVYPRIFGAHDSELRAAIDEAYGDCEMAHKCAMEGNCKDYDCTCPHAPEACDDAGQYDCRFVAGSCDGVFHYAEASCSSACLVTEGFYHAWVEAHHYHCGGEDMSSEWEACSAEEMASNPKTAKLNALVTGKATSQKDLGYMLPSVLPDGRYTPSSKL